MLKLDIWVLYQIKFLCYLNKLSLDGKRRVVDYSRNIDKISVDSFLDVIINVNRGVSVVGVKLYIVAIKILIT